MATAANRITRLVVLKRPGDVWDDTVIAPGAVFRTGLLPGLEVRPEERLGPAEPI